MREETSLVETNIIEGDSTELTPIEIMLQVDENGETTARKLYEFLGLTKSQFARWAKMNIENNVFYEENKDWKGFDIMANGNLCKDYTLTAEFAKHLSMSSQSERGKQARNYFVKVEDKLKEKSNKQSLVVPNDYEEALEALLQSVRETKRLEQQNLVLVKTIEEDKPKVEMYERLMNGENSIEMNQVAKTLKIVGLGRNNLFKTLRNIGILMNNNVPYQKYLEDRGLFEVIFVPIYMGGHLQNKPKTLVTAKGLEYIHKKLKEHGYIDDKNIYNDKELSIVS